ncbi:AraC family transcriptional regulator [Bacillus tianshenii]|uniref:AraC family transcriptional regulator n=1 Tax=Sutcliffiella tianshenii TaxID=1463404 RepID=UPI001CD1C175|nr:AraC family transcriptional regulator [Bacillus tianshenii]MCA1322114.1 AraC family transcriptional regulator [Bacillus tianshenii]
MEVNSLNILSAGAGTVVYPPGGHFGPRTQVNYQLVLLHTGKMGVSINQKHHYEVPQGNLCLLQPGNLEEFHFAKDEETWHSWIDIHIKNMPPEMENRLKFLPFYMPISDAMNQITELMLQIQHTGQTGINNTKCTLGAAVLELFIEETLNQSNVDRLYHPVVLRVKSMIHKRFHEEMTIAELAEDVSMSPDHLVRLFRKHEGVTPSHYLWERRINRGIDLLQNTGLTVSEIAYQAGFKTSQHFARLIKKHTNRTPTEIRMGYREGRNE